MRGDNGRHATEGCCVAGRVDEQRMSGHGGKERELGASPLWVTPQRLATNLVFLFLHRSSQTTSLSSAPWLRPSPSVSTPILFS